ncbi:uncharacterized protein LOC134219596 [Armigeres subalbatus]|uniref:uncharacterized protein LOC134219596 n=1 Tax=Armigeres subalbatus TaxID=124917 RepID=UPI002ECFD41C
MSFIAKNTFLWQKLAVNLNQIVTVDDMVHFLQEGVKILYLQFGLHTKEENRNILDMANLAIEIFSSVTNPWKPVIGIACELSGKGCRLKFERYQDPIKVTTGQKLYLTSDMKYEDKAVEGIIFVTNFEAQTAMLKIGDVLTINNIQLKVCKINGKFVQCCVNPNDNIEIPMLIHPYDRVTLTTVNGNTALTNIDTEECLLALCMNCHYIVIPDVDNHTIIHAVDELIQSHQACDRTIRTIARISPEVREPCVKHLIQHVAGCISVDFEIVRQCKDNCKSVLYEISDMDQLPDEETFHLIDVFIIKPEIIEEFQFSLRELNQRAIRSLAEQPLPLEQGHRAICQCIEYACANCKANAILLCTTTSLCEAEKLSRRKLPCPMLVTTDNEEALYFLLLRKYCFPVCISEDMKSIRQIIKYATIYGRKFEFLKPGNFLVTGFGEHLVQGLELRYVPDDFISGEQ